MKLPFQAEIWFLDQLKYAEFNSIVHFCFKPEAPFLVSEGKQRAIIVLATLRETLK